MTPALPTPVLLPAYAAGSGIPAPALQAAQDAGWTRHEDEAANVTYTSPDEQCVLEFGPETDRYHYDHDRLWSAEYRPGPGQPRAWAAHLGDATPAEAIAAFIRALTDHGGIRANHPGYGAGAGHSESVFAAAGAQGWTRAGSTAIFTGSHGAMHLTHHASPPDFPGQFLADGPHWRTSYRGADGSRDWTGQFSAHVPGEAIAAFLAALTDPDGLDPDRE
jgi:hypothetical protein